MAKTSGDAARKSQIGRAKLLAVATVSKVPIEDTRPTVTHPNTPMPSAGGEAIKQALRRKEPRFARRERAQDTDQEKKRLEQKLNQKREHD